MKGKDNKDNRIKKIAVSVVIQVSQISALVSCRQGAKRSCRQFAYWRVVVKRLRHDVGERVSDCLNYSLARSDR